MNWGENHPILSFFLSFISFFSVLLFLFSFLFFLFNEMLFNCKQSLLSPNPTACLLLPASFSDTMLLIIITECRILSNCLAPAKYIVSILNIKRKLIFLFKELYFCVMVIRCEYSVTLSQIKRASWECFEGKHCTVMIIRRVPPLQYGWAVCSDAVYLLRSCLKTLKPFTILSMFSPWKNTWKLDKKWRGNKLIYQQKMSYSFFPQTHQDFRPLIK